MKHVHLIGIAGTGLSAIAIVLMESGYTVSGSDRQHSPLAERVQEAGGRVYIGHDPRNIRGAEVVVRSSAIPDDNVEVQAAIAAHIPVLKRAEFMGILMAEKQGIAIAGTHGKTTCSAMIAWILTRLGMDPSYIIGGVSKNLDSNAHAGSGPYFVIEADEYDRMFLGLKPTIAVVTNVEYDHPDYYLTSEDFYQAFREFVQRLKSEGVLFTCDDDRGAANLRAEAAANSTRTFSYGLSNMSYDYTANNISTNEFDGHTFDFSSSRWANAKSHEVSLQVPGIHNVQNGLSALAVSDYLELPLADVASALREFRGTERRFEVLDTVCGVTLIDDYAHHPTEILATLTAARERFPDSRIWAVWQPHTYSRTRTLFEQYTTCFEDADHVLVTDVYAAREKPPDNGFSAQTVAEAITNPKTEYVPNLTMAKDYLVQKLRPDDVVLVLSAGDADQLNRDLRKVLKEKDQHTTNQSLRAEFRDQMRTDMPLNRYCAARVGGAADYLLEVYSTDQLEEAVRKLWRLDQPFIILGGGSNVLIGDGGVRGVVIINRARKVQFDESADPPTIWAESGANFGATARQAAQHGLGGLEWAAGIPGTVGGAVIGNAGAHGGDMAGQLIWTDILRREVHTGTPVRERWPVEKLGYTYRSSNLKGDSASTGSVQITSPGAVVLSATMHLVHSTQQAVQAQINEFVAHRKRTQPPGSSMGSMFKNPPNDYAGRLIEACGLKGTRVGDAQISELHANFFINLGSATAADIFTLIKLTQKRVFEEFGVQLELEIELIGDFQA